MLHNFKQTFAYFLTNLQTVLCIMFVTTCTRLTQLLLFQGSSFYWDTVYILFFVKNLTFIISLHTVFHKVSNVSIFNALYGYSYADEP